MLGEEDPTGRDTKRGGGGTKPRRGRGKEHQSCWCRGCFEEEQTCANYLQELARRGAALAHHAMGAYPRGEVGEGRGRPSSALPVCRRRTAEMEGGSEGERGEETE